MAEKVTVPVLGTEIDPSDPSGTGMNIVLTVVALIMGGAIVTAAVVLWNEIAARTPDEVQEVRFA